MRDVINEIADQQPTYWPQQVRPSAYCALKCVKERYQVRVTELASSLSQSLSSHVIPGSAGADWYARGVGGAAARGINKIPTGIPPLQEL
jgi:hypothetical protein